MGLLGRLLYAAKDKEYVFADEHERLDASGSLRTLSTIDRRPGRPAFHHLGPMPPPPPPMKGSKMPRRFRPHHHPQVPEQARSKRRLDLVVQFHCGNLFALSSRRDFNSFGDRSSSKGGSAGAAAARFGFKAEANSRSAATRSRPLRLRSSRRGSSSGKSMRSSLLRGRDGVHRNWVPCLPYTSFSFFSLLMR